MESHNDWILGLPPISRRSSSRIPTTSSMLTPFQQNPLWKWVITNQSVVLPIAVLFASVLLSSNILDLLVLSTTTVLPDRTRQKLWDLIVAASPASLLFWLEDTMAPRRPDYLGRPSSSRRKNSQARAQAARAATGRFNKHQAKSDALENTLGLGPQGRRRNLKSTYSQKLGRLASAVSQNDPNRPRGILNPGNWCYRNATLQGLSSLDSMTLYLKNALRAATDAKFNKGNPKKTQQNIKTVKTLSDLIGDLRAPIGNLSYLQTTPALEKIKGLDQQDAQEYLLKLLDTVEVELKGAGVINTKAQLALTPPRPLTPVKEAAPQSAPMSRSDSSASDATVTDHGAAGTTSPGHNFRLPLEADVAERKACKDCGFSEGMRLDPTCCILLSMPYTDMRNDKAGFDLEDLLDNYCAGEVLSGVDCSNCTLLKLRDNLVQKMEALATKAVEEGKAETCAEKQESDEIDAEKEEKKNLAELEARLSEIEHALATKTFDDDTLINKCKVQKGDYVRSDKAKQIGFASAPPGLAIQVSRINFFNQSTKDNRPVHFPKDLDFSPWYLGSTSRKPSHSIAVDSLEGKDRDIVQELAHQPRKPVYRLRSAVMHTGSAQSGHYYCYRQHPPNSVSAQPRNKTPAKPPAKRLPSQSPAPVPPPPASDVGDFDMATLPMRKQGTPCDFDDDGTTVVGSEYGTTDEVAMQHDDITADADDEADDDGHKTEIATVEETEDKTSSQPPHKKQRRGEQDTKKADAPPAEQQEEAPWWRISDLDVYKAGEGDVHSEPGKVYMLFYDRVLDDEEIAVESVEEDSGAKIVGNDFAVDPEPKDSAEDTAVDMAVNNDQAAADDDSVSKADAPSKSEAETPMSDTDDDTDATYVE